jgi:hypothetical protein
MAEAPIMDELKEVFRGLILRPLRPVEDKDGVRIGEDVRVTKEKDAFLVRFLKDTAEKRRKQIRETLTTKGVTFKEGKDYKD